jgi:hypothetical protein
MWWLGRKRRQEESTGSQPDTMFLVFDIRVSDDGTSLTGRRYAGYLAEVERRQETGKAQDEVTIWHRQPGVVYTLGTPRVNTAKELEVISDDGQVLGVVREMNEQQLYYFPA